MTRSSQWHRSVPVHALLFLTMFFSTWGSGMQKLSLVDLSKLFPILALLVILYAGLFVKKKIVFPRAFNWFTVFYLAHMILAYGLVFRAELDFGYQGATARGADFVSVNEGPGIACARIVIFLAFGYALAALLWDRRRLRWAAIGYGAGLSSVLALGGYVSTDVSRTTSEVRNAGGFLDPNSFGFAGLTAIVLALLAWSDAGKDKKLKAALGAAVTTGALVILQSGSRASMMGILFGFIVIMVCTDNLSRKMNMFLAGGLAAFIAFTFMPGTMMESLKERASVGRMKADRGANRLDIWSNYLSEFPSYAVAGVGILRSKEVIRNNYTAEFAITHNQFLEILVETGLVGFLLFLAGLARLWRSASLAVDPERPLMRPVLLAALIGLFTEFMFLNAFYSRDTWILFGVVAGLANNGRSDD